MPNLSRIWTPSRHEGPPLQVPLDHPPPCVAALRVWAGVWRSSEGRRGRQGSSEVVKRQPAGAGGRASGQGGGAEELRPRQPQRQLRREERGAGGRAQRPAEKGQRRHRLPASARLITRSPLAADLREQINQRARLDEICCYCAHF